MSTNKSIAAAELKAFFDTQPYGHASSLTLTNYGEGYAWLEPKTEPKPSIDDDRRYVLTDAGRRDLRMADTHDPGPKASEWEQAP